MEQEQSVTLTKESNAIALLTLNRPERHNAFDDKLIQQLLAQLQNLQADPTTRIILLKANGKNFSAGADLEWMKKIAQYSESENIADALQLVELLKTLQKLSKPTIALANGITMGGGIGLLACCDIVIAEQEARFCFSEAKLGLVPATIAPYVINAIGARTALYYFLTAQIFSATEAKQINLVHEVAIEKDLLTSGMDLAVNLLKNGPNALTTIKQFMAEYISPSDTLLQGTAKLIATVRAHAEAQEGLNAFFEKRPPRW
jgi:methylglutaconyl-CoA hydratase